MLCLYIYYDLWYIVRFEITIIVAVASDNIDGVLLVEEKSEFDTIADILRLSVFGLKESEFRNSWEEHRGPIENYIPAMIVLKLVNAETKKNAETQYRITSRGLEFLRFYHGMKWLLWGRDFDFMLINVLTRLKMEAKPFYVR